MKSHLIGLVWAFSYAGFDQAYDALAEAGSDWRLAALGLSMSCFVMLMHTMYMIGRKEFAAEFIQLAASKTDFSIVVTDSQVRFEPKPGGDS